MTEIACVAHTKDVLGEVPVWSAEEGALYWIDDFKPAVHRLRPATGEVTSWTPPEKLGSMALRAMGGLLLATRAGLAFYEPESGAFEVVCDPEPDLPDNLLNDGRCDRRGRFWVGSMDKPLANPTGRLHRIDSDLSVHTFEREVWVSNGIAFGPDDRVMYFADSHRRAIYAYDLDLDAGEVRNRRVFATVPEGEGVPDGATVDAEGFLWSARFDGGRVVRHAPDGRVDREVALPVSRPTSCMFGGPGLDVLYVTTATFRLPEERRMREPWAGGLLAVDVGVRGLPEPRFGG
jgi:sugar lactone lactonase YvrE